MATCMDDMYKSLDEFERELTCGICQEQYTEPKVLPCLHYYCKKCIVKNALKNQFSCLKCSKEIDVTSGRVVEDELPPVPFINQLEELFSKQKKALCEKGTCEMCIEACATAEAFCKQCKKFACAECVKAHHQMKSIFEAHQIISMSDVRHVEPDELVPPPSKKCKTHDEQQKMYCFQCKLLMCRDCTIINHKDHEVEFSKQVAASHRQTLSEKKEVLEGLKLKLSDAVKEVQVTAEEIQAQGSEVKKIVEESFERLQKSLLERRMQVLDELEHRVHEKTVSLMKQKKSLNKAGAKIQSVLDYAERCVKYCSNEELTVMFSEIDSRMQDRADSLRGEGVSLNPVEEVDICPKTDCETLLKFNRQVAQISIKVVPAIVIPDQVLCSVAHTVTMIVTLANEKQLKGNP